MKVFDLIEEHIVCLECNKFLKSLTSHVYLMHGLTRDEYVNKHNLPLGYRMASTESRARMQTTAILNNSISRMKVHVFSAEERKLTVQKRTERNSGRPRSEKMVKMQHLEMQKTRKRLFKQRQAEFVCANSECPNKVPPQKFTHGRKQKYCSVSCYRFVVAKTNGSEWSKRLYNLKVQRRTR